ncbi:DivIVA family protein [Mycobacterium tuberculosis TKK_03_0026]|nr:DivIVA family protein [Mycobacterium tuberculosis TKK_03_0026]
MLPQRPNCTKLFRPRRGVSERYRVTTAHNGSAPRFQRTRSGYDPVAVNHYIAELVLRQQAQHCEIETLKAEIASLKDENAALKDTSPSAQAVTDRMAKMLRLAVDEVFQMQSEARAEAATLVSAARDEAEAVRTQKREMLADMNARQRALESEHADVMRRAREEAEQLVAQATAEVERMRVIDARRREKAEQELDAEIIRLRTDAQFQIDDQLQATQQECEKRLGEAKIEADRRLHVADEQIEHGLSEARRTLEETSQRRVGILEQLARIHAQLENIPALLESARHSETEPLQSINGAVAELRAI